MITVADCYGVTRVTRIRRCLVLSEIADGLKVGDWCSTLDEPRAFQTGSARC